MDYVPIVRDIYAEWAAGNYRAGLELVAADVHFEVHVPIPEADVYVGVAGMQRYMRRFLETWSFYEIHGRSFEQVGSSVVVRVFHRGRAGDVPVETHFFTTWTFEAGRVVRIDVSQDREAGLSAATSTPP